MLDQTVSNRIAMLRPLLIIAMVFSHLRGLSTDMSDIAPGFFNHFNAFVVHGLGKGTVPTMSLIAGFLLFSMNLDLQACKLFKKKFMTLVVPFVFFNLAYVAYMWFTNVTMNMTRNVEILEAVQKMGWFDLLFGINQYPINGPMHFVRDLIVFVLFAPLLGGIIRTVPVLGLFGMIIIFGFNQDGDLVFRGTSFIVFYIGGMAAIHNWNMTALDKYAKQCAVLFVLICIALMTFKMKDNTILVMAAPFLIWPAASLLTNTRVEAWGMKYSKYSFFVFAAHMPFMEQAWWLVTHQLKFVPYVVYWVFAPLVIMGALVLVYNVSMRYAPTAFNLIIGCRGSKPKRVERRKTARPVNAPVYSAEERVTLAH
jgi:succinoglycan biosynthesis protein ExoH